MVQTYVFLNCDVRALCHCLIQESAATGTTGTTFDVLENPGDGDFIEDLVDVLLSTYVPVPYGCINIINTWITS